MPRARRKEIRPARAARARQAMTAGEAAFVEETAVLYESFGLPRMAGRIMAWLFLCDPPHQSLAQLGQALQASKGSISTMTRTLLQFGLIKRLSLPGDRRDYVMIPVGWLSHQMANQTQRASMIRRLAEQGLQVLKHARPEQQSRLREMRDLYAFLEQELPALLARWERSRVNHEPRHRARRTTRRAEPEALPGHP